MGRIIDQDSVLLDLGLSSSCTDEELDIVIASIKRAESIIQRHLRYDPVYGQRTEFYPVKSDHGSSGYRVWEANETSAYVRHTTEAATTELFVRHLPVRSSPSIDLRIDYDGRFGTRLGSFGSDSVKTEGDDFWPDYDGQDDDGNGICRNGLLRSVGLWPMEPGAVKIVYYSGYTADEFDGTNDLVDATGIYGACVAEAVRLAKKVMVNKKTSRGFLAGPITSEGLGDYNYSIDSAASGKLYGSSTSITPESREMLQDFVNWAFVL